MPRLLTATGRASNCVAAKASFEANAESTALRIRRSLCEAASPRGVPGLVLGGRTDRENEASNSSQNPGDQLCHQLLVRRMPADRTG